ncbi:MAG: trypsin-like peptidase domain-containing protein [Bryobacterales bacterium]|nr:trypsin-like peptidase domain-containing protein [Bryobacterales bacterium]
MNTLLLDHVRQLLAKEGWTPGPESALESALADPAEEAVERIERGQEVPPHLEDALEAIVLPKLRPVFDIKDDTFAPLPNPWTELNNRRTALKQIIRGIGRVDAPGIPYPYAGTAFLVGKDVLLTNRHVAEIFTDGLGVKNLRFKSGLQPEIDLKQEIGSTSEVLVKIKETLLIHPHWDAALLRVEGLPASRRPLLLAGSEVPQPVGRLVAAIGYPALDPRNDIDLQKRIFRVFEKKRLQPGRLMASRQIVSFNNTVEALAHDCSTLGGNSGSAVIDIETGLAVGLHFAGRYLEANFAVPAWELALDSRVVDFGVQFANPPNPKPSRDWLSRWAAL